MSDRAKTRVGFRALARGARAYARLDRRLRTAQRVAQHTVHGLLYAALTPAERARIAVEAYDSLYSSADVGGFHSWERVWFSARLPSPPARVLVGAAGDGREASVLQEMGYRVDAVEPAPRPARVCQRRLGTAGHVFVERLEDTALRALRGDDPELARGTYDAVVIGWGGLSHILDPEDRMLVLRGCDLLAPDGPILASFFLRTNNSQVSRAQRIGSAAGRAIAWLRRLSPTAESTTEPLCFASWFGFAKTFSEADIEALGNAVGRGTRWEGEGSISTYPHVTFVAGQSERQR